MQGDAQKDMAFPSSVSTGRSLPPSKREAGVLPLGNEQVGSGEEELFTSHPWDWEFVISGGARQHRTQQEPSAG